MRLRQQGQLTETLFAEPASPFVELLARPYVPRQGPDAPLGPMPGRVNYRDRDDAQSLLEHGLIVAGLCKFCGLTHVFSPDELRSEQFKESAPADMDT